MASAFICYYAFIYYCHNWASIITGDHLDAKYIFFTPTYFPCLPIIAKVNYPFQNGNPFPCLVISWHENHKNDNLHL